MEIIKKYFWYLVLGLIVIRVIMVFLFISQIPATDFFQTLPTGFAGDEGGYFRVAKSFSQFEIKDYPGFGTIGSALYLVPFIWLTGAEGSEDIAYPVFIFQSFILYPISILLVAYIFKFLLKSNLLSLFGTAIYVFYPYFLYFLNIGPYVKNTQHFFHAMWFPPVMTDAPSAFFCYLTVAMAIFSLQKIKNRNFIITGIFAGFSALVRITNILLGVATGVYLLINKKFKEFCWFSLFAIVIFSMQLFFNFHNYGNFFHFSQFNNDVVQAENIRHETQNLPGHIDKVGFYSPQNYLYLLTVADKYIPNLSLVLTILITFLVLVVRFYFKKDKQAAVFVGLWVILYFIYYAGFHPAARNLRYWLPIIPALIILLLIFFNMTTLYTIKTINLLKKYV